MNGKLPLITACEQCWRDGDAQASHEELQQEVNYGFQPAPAISKEPCFSEPVHEKPDAQPGCARHIGEGLLADILDCSLGSTVLAETSKQEQSPSYSLFAGIEKLVNQSLMISEVPRQQICDVQL